jgi:AcrR family transcriptional regulator
VSVVTGDTSTVGESTRAYADALAGADQIQLRPTPAAAFARAREQFRAGVRLDMAALATQLGIARATLYRWTGDRDRLLADLCIVELDDLLRYLDSSTADSGAQRLERIAGAFLRALTDNAAFQRFLQHEGEHGFRLVTAANGRVRQHLVHAVADLIEREVSERDYRPPADPAVLADGIVAVGERFLYHSGDAAMNPDPATAQVVISLLLREA